jgi:hypothetical protein
MVVFYLYFLAVYLGVEVAVPHQEDNPHHHTTTAPHHVVHTRKGTTVGLKENNKVGFY